MEGREGGLPIAPFCVDFLEVPLPDFNLKNERERKQKKIKQLLTKLLRFDLKFTVVPGNGAKNLMCYFALQVINPRLLLNSVASVQPCRVVLRDRLHRNKSEY